MAPAPRKSNRGPAAAQENREAIIAAARTLFAERGYAVPLTAIAQAAGVSQGVLYRHFSGRVALALAAFESHWAEFEELAADPAPGALQRVWQRLVELTIQERGFIEAFQDQRRANADYEGHDKMAGILAAPLERAVAAGLVDPALTPDDLMLGVSMAYGVVVTSVDDEGLPERVSRALGRAGLLPAFDGGA